uniref:Uncharacterized protein n=1 Tax=Cacopsylla melanoneura TaxID=428564 RepID=A0A8D8V5D9_9HEMI
MQTQSAVIFFESVFLISYFFGKSSVFFGHMVSLNLRNLTRFYFRRVVSFNLNLDHCFHCHCLQFLLIQVSCRVIIILPGCRCNACWMLCLIGWWRRLYIVVFRSILLNAASTWLRYFRYISQGLWRI